MAAEKALALQALFQGANLPIVGKNAVCPMGIHNPPLDFKIVNAIQEQLLLLAFAADKKEFLRARFGLARRPLQYLLQFLLIEGLQ